MASDSDDAEFFDRLVEDDDDGPTGLPASATDAAPAEELSALALDDADAVGTPEPPAATPPEPQPAEAVDPPPPHTVAEVAAALPEAEDRAAPPKAGSDTVDQVAPPLPEAEHTAAPPKAEAGADAEVAAPLPEAEHPSPPTEPEAETGSEAEVAAVLPEVKTAGTAAVAAPEGVSPGSGKGVHTAVRQAQWSAFGGDSIGAGADPFGELLATGNDDAFLGGNSTAVGSSNVAATDHSFFSGAGTNAMSQLDWGASTDDFLAGGSAADDAFFGASLAGDPGTQASVVGTSSASATDQSFFSGVDSNANSQLHMGASSVDHNTGTQSEWTGGAVESSDPSYSDDLYPGWKLDPASQLWYQIATTGVQGSAAPAYNVQQQQQFGVVYTHNSSQAGLETIAEEGSTTAATWGQDQSSAAAADYPPNMLFDEQYPGWYFDTITQNWHSLELYQQSLVQTATTAAPSDRFAGAGHNVAHAGNYNQQSQWQDSSLVNSMQPGSLGDNSLLDSSYGSQQHSENQIIQQADTKLLESSTTYPADTSTFVPTLESSTNYQTSVTTFVPSLGPTANYRTDINTFVPSTSQYSSNVGHQASHKGFEPTNYQSAHKGFEPYTNNQSASTSHQSGHQGFNPSTSKGFEPTSYQSTHNGFQQYKSNQSTSASHQVGYRVSAPSTDHQEFQPFTNNQGSTGFVPSEGYQMVHKEVEPSKDNQASYVALDPSASHGYSNLNGFAESQNFVPTASMYQTRTQADPAAHMHLANSFYSPHEQWSSAGRPSHTLFAFGFGGKLLVMKDTSSMTTNFDSGNQGKSCGVVSMLNISEIIADKIDQPSIPNGSALSYFHTLCRQPIPGPLVGGSAAAKDVTKWLDEIIGCYESSLREFQGGDVQKLLISLLKILCQNYGKLRSPFGSDPSQEGMDGPDMAVTKLFSSSKSSSAQMREYGAIVHCMKNLPSENQIQATAQEVQNLLVSGRRKEALQSAQEGQLWGPALVLALQLGDKFYADTVKKMAYCHFLSGSPLRTLCLLIAGQPADVFNVEKPVDANYGTLHGPQQSAEGTPKGMLDEWQQNLAIITANRTKGDDLVITHLGDCLWREKNEVAAAHSCYLVAELNIDTYSESARMCLIGANHLRCPRTFASPEAIQRTELYEYSKVLGNSQYILLPFQPYKLIYAYMLAEVGKVSDSLRYCQASLKVLKASGRAPELEAWKLLFSSLEERIRTHQQGGYGVAPAKFVGKIFTTIDKSLSRMMGTQPASSAPLPQGPSNDREFYPAPAFANVEINQSMTPMSSLMSSVSEQSMSGMAEDGAPGRKGAHNRSVSEPDFARNTKQGAGSSNAQSTSSSGSSRFGWLLQKTVGLVSKSPHQAKLGEQNKFYYDEKLKRWVEEGAEIPAEQPPPPPPPTKTSFPNGMPDYNSNAPSSGGYIANGFPGAKPPNPSELGSSGMPPVPPGQNQPPELSSSGMPPMPPSQNQFSARGRMGVRSRYVDTFNKGRGNSFGAAASYSKPAAPSMNPLPGASLFVPTPAVAFDPSPESTGDAHSETAHQDEPSSSPAVEASFASPPTSVPMRSNIQHYPSMDNIMTPSGSGNSSFSRSRAASWSGTYPDQLGGIAASRSPDGQTMQSPPLIAASRSPDGQTMQSPPLIPGRRPSHSRSSSNSSSVQLSGGFGEDLQDVEL